MTSTPLKITTLSIADLEQIDAICQHYPLLNWNAVKLHETLAHPNSLTLGLFQASELLAFALFNYVVDEAELLIIATHVDVRQQGYARMLFQEALKALRQKDIQKIFLEVRPSNAVALRLYERMGFSRVGLRKQYYPDYEDALILSIDL
jgi:ribosomal-protein-alanine N-acetyltransferase